MNKVLLPIDLGQDAATERVMEQAKALSERAETTFLLLYVMDEIPSFVEAEIPSELLSSHEANAREQLRECARAYGLEDRSEPLVRRGPAHHEIVKAAEEAGADLIVMPSHQPSGADILLGSTAASVIRHAHCSVMVLR